MLVSCECMESGKKTANEFRFHEIWMATKQRRPNMRFSFSCNSQLWWLHIVMWHLHTANAKWRHQRNILCEIKMTSIELIPLKWEWMQMTPRKCAEFNCIDYAEAATLRSGPTIIATISGYSFRFVLVQFQLNGGRRRNGWRGFCRKCRDQCPLCTVIFQFEIKKISFFSCRPMIWIGHRMRH